MINTGSDSQNFGLCRGTVSDCVALTEKETSHLSFSVSEARGFIIWAAYRPIKWETSVLPSAVS